MQKLLHMKTLHYVVDHVMQVNEQNYYLTGLIQIIVKRKISIKIQSLML